MDWEKLADAGIDMELGKCDVSVLLKVILWKEILYKYGQYGTP